MHTGIKQVVDNFNVTILFVNKRLCSFDASYLMTFLQLFKKIKQRSFVLNLILEKISEQYSHFI